MGSAYSRPAYGGGIGSYGGTYNSPVPRYGGYGYGVGSMGGGMAGYGGAFGGMGGCTNSYGAGGFGAGPYSQGEDHFSVRLEKHSQNDCGLLPYLGMSSETQFDIVS